MPVTESTETVASPTARGGGVAVRVDDDRAALAGDARRLEGRCVGAHADREHDDVGRESGAVGEHNRVGIRRVLDARGRDSGAHLDPELAELLRDEPGQLRLERRERVWGELDDGDLQALSGQRLRGLDPDEAGAEHDGPPSPRVHLVTEGDSILHGAQRPHSGGVEARQWGAEGGGTWREHERVVGQLVGALLRVHRHGLRGRVEGRDLAAGAHVEVESRPQRRRGLHQ